MPCLRKGADWLTGPRRRFILIATALIALVASIGASRVELRQQVKREFSPSFGFVQDDQVLNDRLGGTNAIYVLVEGQEPDAIKAPRVLQAMEKTQHLLEQQPQVGKTLSLVDFIKRMNRAMHRDDPAWDRLPESADLISQ